MSQSGFPQGSTARGGRPKLPTFRTNKSMQECSCGGAFRRGGSHLGSGILSGGRYLDDFDRAVFDRDTAVYHVGKDFTGWGAVIHRVITENV